MAEYEEIKKHIGHDVTIVESDNGDIYAIEDWSPPPTHVWHGKEYGRAGGEVDVHD